MKDWTEEHLKSLLAAGKIQGYEIQNTKGKPAEKKKGSKYKNVKVFVDGIEFDSKREATRYHNLKLRLLGGTIRNLQIQVEFRLEVEGSKVASYFADFTYEELTVGGWQYVVEDVKSSATRKLKVYRLKKKLMLAIHNIEIREV
jgi:hypothetical protein